MRSCLRALVAAILTAAVPAVTASQLLLVEDFEYPAGDSLTHHAWEVSGSGTTKAILTVEPGLEFTKYPGSGKGNAALVQSTGQDLYREFPSDSSGTIYLFCMVKVLAAQTGDYFLHLNTSPPSANMFARTFVRMAANGLLAFGIAKKGTNTTPTYQFSDSVYHTDSTYLLIVRYQFRQGNTSDDEASLFVIDQSSLSPEDLLHPTVGPVTDYTKDAATLGSVALRQGDQKKAPTLIVDGIRVVHMPEGTAGTELTHFRAEWNPGGGVRIEWSTGWTWSVLGFEIQRAHDTPDLFETLVNSYQPVDSDPTDSMGYLFIDSSASPGTWFYRVKQINVDSSSRYSPALGVQVLTSVQRNDEKQQPSFDVYPNPFNSSAQIQFMVRRAGHVTAEVFDVLGRSVEVLFDGDANPGQIYRFRLGGEKLATGSYVIRLKSADGAATRRVLLVR